MWIIWATIEYLVAILVIIIKQNQNIYEVKDEKCEKNKGKRDTLGAIGNNACQKSKVKCLKKDKRKELCQCMFAAECNLIYHFYVQQKN